MIKFFRRIRQNLLSENRFNKYLFYAGGEILLVVIGILIALQINNWNEHKKIGLETKSYLERLLTETQINLKKVENEMAVEKSQISSSKMILDMFTQKRDSLKTHTLDSLLGIIYYSNAVDMNSGIFTEGINGGIIGNLQSEELRTSLYGFVGKVEDLKRQEELWTNDLNRHFGRFLFEHINYRRMDNSFGDYKGQIGPTRFQEFDNLSVLNSMEFENHIDNRYYNNSRQLEEYEALYLELQHLEELIKQELAQ